MFRTAQGVRDKILNLEQTQMGTQVFTLWDYGLSDDENSAIRHNNIFREIKVRNVFVSNNVAILRSCVTVMMMVVRVCRCVHGGW